MYKRLSQSVSFVQPHSKTTPKKSHISYADIQKQASSEAGETNLNEYLPYTIVTIVRRLFYVGLFFMNYNHLSDKETAYNGIALKSDSSNLANGASIVFSGCLLMLLGANFLSKSKKLEKAFTKLFDQLEQNALDDANHHSYSQVMKTKHRLIKSNNIKFIRALHTLLTGVFVSTDGILMIAKTELKDNNAHANLTKTEVDEGMLFELGKIMAFITVASFLFKNLYDLTSNALKLNKAISNQKHFLKSTEMSFYKGNGRPDEIRLINYGSIDEPVSDRCQMIKVGIGHQLSKQKSRKIKSVISGAFVTASFLSALLNLSKAITPKVGVYGFLFLGLFGQTVGTITTSKNKAQQKVLKKWVQKQKDEGLDILIPSRDKNHLLSSIFEILNQDNALNSPVNEADRKQHQELEMISKFLHTLKDDRLYAEPLTPEGVKESGGYLLLQLME